jgi:hypothetical protein
MQAMPVSKIVLALLAATSWTPGGVGEIARIWAVGARVLPWACQTKGRRASPTVHTKKPRASVGLDRGASIGALGLVGTN